MALTGPAVLLIMNDVAAGADVAFDQWYIDEHLPERIAVPGFLRGRRWRALGAGPRDLTLYEMAGVETVRSPAYLARTAAPTPATRAMMAHFLEMSRSVCHVRFRQGAGDGGVAAFLPLARDAAPQAALAAALANARTVPGIVAVSLLDADAMASGGDSAESRLRRAPDRMIDCAVWIEATGQDAAAAAVNRITRSLPAAAQPLLYRFVAGMAA